jgi:hypothetical protein
VAPATSPRASATVATTITATATISVSQPSSPVAMPHEHVTMMVGSDAVSALARTTTAARAPRARKRDQWQRAQLRRVQQRPEPMDELADRDEERSAEGTQDGDIRLRHRRPPVVLDKSGGKRG